MNEGLEGGCACGSVRYRLASAPMFVHCCHCRDCQRQTGSAFVINALIETDRVTLSGEPEPVAVPTDSGRPHRLFSAARPVARRCGASMAAARLRFVRVGTLDDPAALPPDIHIYTRSKLPWVDLAGRQPRPSRPITMPPAVARRQPRAPPRCPPLTKPATPKNAVKPRGTEGNQR